MLGLVVDIFGAWIGYTAFPKLFVICFGIGCIIGLIQGILIIFFED